MSQNNRLDSPKKILIIDEEIPIPLDTGKKIRTYNLLIRLSKWFEILYVSYVDYDRDFEKIKKLKKLNIKVFPVKKPLKRRKKGILFLFNLFLNFFSKYPYVVANHYSYKMKKQINKILRAYKVDLIHVEISPYSIFLKDINIGKYKTVFVAHNVESDIWWRFYKNEKNLFKKLYLKLQYIKMVNFENKFLNYFDGIVVSDKDANFFKQNSNFRNIFIIENGVDIKFYKNTQNIFPQNHKLIFTGSMDWRPNQDAIMFFIKEIYPLIKEEIKDVKLMIIGRYPPLKLKEIERLDHSIFVSGWVEDTRSYILKAQVFVVPLRIGGGTRLKILEALSMKKPVISTSVGAEGLKVLNGKHLLIADKNEDFAEKTIHLLKNINLCKKLGYEGRRLVEKYYSWEKIAEKQRHVWDEIIK